MQTSLEGKDEVRAKKAMILAVGDGESLLSEEILVEPGFAHAEVVVPPAQGGDAGAAARDEPLHGTSVSNHGTPVKTHNSYSG